MLIVVSSSLLVLYVTLTNAHMIKGEPALAAAGQGGHASRRLGDGRGAPPRRAQGARLPKVRTRRGERPSYGRRTRYKWCLYVYVCSVHMCRCLRAHMCASGCMCGGRAELEEIDRRKRALDDENARRMAAKRGIVCVCMIIISPYRLKHWLRLNDDKRLVACPCAILLQL